MTSVGDTIASAVLVVEMEKEQLEEGERKEEVEREGPSVLGSLLVFSCMSSEMLSLK